MIRGKEGVRMIELTDSLEDYLESIYLLEKRNGCVGVTDIAKDLGLSKPSVNKAVNILKTEGLLIQKRYGKIKLTELGADLAKDVYFRHESLMNFLVDDIGIDPKIAESEACKIEHIISKDSLCKIISYAKKNRKY